MKHICFFTKQLKTHFFLFILCVFLSLILSFSAIALLSLSGWFIAASAFAGLTAATVIHFNYFLPSAMIRYLALTRILSRYAERLISHDFTFKILTTLRVWFYQILIPLSPASLLGMHSGELLNRIVSDIDTLDNLYLRVIAPFLTTFSIMIIVTWFFHYFDFVLSMIAVSFLLFALLLTVFLSMSAGKTLGKNSVVKTAQLRTILIDKLQGFSELLIFLPRHQRMLAIQAHQNALQKSQNQFAYLKGWLQAGLVLLSGLSVFFILITAIPLVNQHHFSGAILAMLILCLFSSFEQWFVLPLASLSLTKSKEAAARLMQLATQKPVVTFHAAAKNDIVRTHDLTLQHVQFRYSDQEKQVLNEVSLEIPAGSCIAIVGPSGSGKSTLLHLMARIWDPTSGAILLDHQNLKTYSENTVRKNIILVTQQVHIFHTSVRDNLSLMQKNYSDEKLWEALALVEFDKEIAALPQQLDAPMGEFGKYFSGGQIRRIALARALLHDAPIILLDEPSIGLNADLMDRIWQNMKMKCRNKTIIIATHDENLLKNVPCNQLSVNQISS